MGSGKEKHPHRKLLQAIADELSMQQDLAVKIADDANEEYMCTDTLNMGNLLIANGRMVQSQTDLLWVTTLLRRGYRSKEIIKIMKRKDESSRTANGAHDNTIIESNDPDEPTHA